MHNTITYISLHKNSWQAQSIFHKLSTFLSYHVLPSNTHACFTLHIAHTVLLQNTHCPKFQHTVEKAHNTALTNTNSCLFFVNFIITIPTEKWDDFGLFCILTSFYTLWTVLVGKIQLLLDNFC